MASPGKTELTTDRRLANKFIEDNEVVVELQSKSRSRESVPTSTC